MSKSTASPSQMTSDEVRQIAVIGLTGFVAWTTMLLCFDGPLRDRVSGGAIVHDPFFCAPLLTAFPVLLAASLRSKLRADGKVADFLNAMEGGWAFAAWVVLGSICSAAAIVVSRGLAQSSIGPQLLVFALGAATGPAAALLTLRWGRIVSSLAVAQAVPTICFSLCGQWMVLCIVVILGIWAKLLAAVGLPIVSWLCLTALSRQREAALEAGGVDEEDGPWRSATTRSAASPDGAANRKPRRRIAGVPFLVRAAAAVFCFCFVVQLITTFHAKMGDGIGQDAAWFLFLVVFAVVTASVRLCLAATGQVRSFRPELFYRVAFSFAVLACVAFALVPDIPAFAVYVGIYAAYALITLTAWTLSWSSVLLKGERPDRVFGTLFAAEFCAFLAGFAVSQAETALGGGDASVRTVLLAAALLLLAFCFVLPDRELAPYSPQVARLSREGLEGRCRVLADQFGLTEREAEIFVFLARGRDVQFVERELKISRNTVKTHRKNLYRKLGVHTQQELLSLIEEPE